MATGRQCQSSDSHSPVIGIDLGTSKCCVAVVRNGKVEILENERGNKTTPSYVAFTDTETLVGEEAKDQAALNLTNTIFGIKRIIGRNMSDPQLLHDQKHWPYKLGEIANKPLIKVMYKGETRSFCPELITSMLLTKMKQIAESHLKCPVQAAVISVPANFNNAQRQATKDAAEIAGLKVLALVNEPTASAIAYLEGKENVQEDVLIVDFGGGNLDLALIKIQNGFIEVTSVAGRTGFGGLEFDILLMNYIKKQIKFKIKHDESSYLKLRQSCEEYKEKNSIIPYGFNAFDVYINDRKVSVNRSEYNSESKKMIESVMKPILQTIPCDNVKVLLTGAVSSMPIVKKFLAENLEATSFSAITIDGSVAAGAARVAAMASGKHPLSQIKYKDIYPHNLYAFAGGKMCMPILSSTSYPFSGKINVVISKNKVLKLKEKCVSINKNGFTENSIGKITYCKIQPSKLPAVISYYIDKNGLFQSTLYSDDKEFLQQPEATIDHTTREELIAVNKSFAADGKVEKERQDSVAKLELLCCEFKRKAKAELEGDNAELYRSLYEECDKTLSWLESTPCASRLECQGKNNHMNSTFQSAETALNSKKCSISFRNAAEDPISTNKLAPNAVSTPSKDTTVLDATCSIHGSASTTSFRNSQTNLFVDDLKFSKISASKVCRCDSDAKNSAYLCTSKHIVPDSSHFASHLNNGEPNNHRKMHVPCISECSVTSKKKIVDSNHSINQSNETSIPQHDSTTHISNGCIERICRNTVKKHEKKTINEIHDKNVDTLHKQNIDKLKDDLTVHYGNNADIFHIGHADTEKKYQSPVIGIDLGTSKCCVAVVRNGKVEILENERGNKTTPSYVAFTDTERLVGEEAKDHAAFNPTNTVFGIKRIIGRTTNDSMLADKVKYTPCSILIDQEEPLVEVTYRRNQMTFRPEQLTAMLLTKMKQIAESHLKCPVEAAVISVPANFNNAQRQATKDAAEIAGLKVLELINEPTAAALAYMDGKENVQEQVYVVDFGGGKLDAALISLENENVIVRNVAGNVSLGGLDIDSCLCDYLANIDKNNYAFLPCNKQAKVKLFLASEKLKHTLSILRRGHVEIDCLFDQNDFENTLKRSDFEKLCFQLMKFNVEAVFRNLFSDVQQSTYMQMCPPSRVLLVGGCTRIPMVQDTLRRVFGDIPLDKSLNADEAVGHGAALRAAALAGQGTRRGVKIQEIYPHRISIASASGELHTLVDNYTTITNKHSFSLTDDFRKEFTLVEHYFFPLDISSHTNKLLHFKSNTLSDCCVSNSTLYLEYYIDSSGILCPSLLYDGKHSSLVTTQKNISEMIQSEKKFVSDCSEEKKRIKCICRLEIFCLLQLSKFKEKNQHQNNEIKIILDLLDETINLLDSSTLVSLKECKERRIKIESCIRRVEHQIIGRDVRHTNSKVLKASANQDERTVQASEATDNSTNRDKGRSRSLNRVTTQSTSNLTISNFLERKSPTLYQVNSLTEMCSTNNREQIDFCLKVSHQNQRSENRSSEVTDESINRHRQRSHSLNGLPTVTASVYKLTPKNSLERKSQTLQKSNCHKNSIQRDIRDHSCKNTNFNNRSKSIQPTSIFHNLSDEDQLPRKPHLLTGHDHEIYNYKIFCRSRSVSMTNKESSQSNRVTSDATTSISNSDGNVNSVGLNQNLSEYKRVLVDRTMAIVSSSSDPNRHSTITEKNKSTDANPSRTSFKNTECISLSGSEKGCHNDQFMSTIPKIKEELRPCRNSEHCASNSLLHSEERKVKKMVNKTEEKHTQAE